MIRLIKNFVLNRKHLFYLLLYPVVVGLFQLAEIINTDVDHWVWSPLDYHIPYIGAFVIPYLLWFVYMAVTIAVLALYDKEEYFKLLTCIYIGMTFCCVVYLAFPHGQPLREPLTGSENNLFDWLVANVVYANDTPENTAPSIHVINSIFTTIALQRTYLLRGHRIIRAGVHLLNLSIIASTLLIKQHSIIDVILGLALAIVLYLVVYKVDWKDQAAFRRTKEMQAA